MQHSIQPESNTPHSKKHKKRLGERKRMLKKHKKRLGERRRILKEHKKRLGENEKNWRH
jgi:hypothetical protein